ncbi:PHD finger protein ALFIN-LIKE 1, partial [Mucuna pruriens]
MDFNICTVEEIFADYKGRKTALIRALTNDVDEIFKLCDPDKDCLCLYGYPNGTWEVTRPQKFLPADLPEPVLGINWSRDFARDDRKWLSMVSLHSDSWLLSVAFYLGVHLNRDERERLFSLINDLPTIFEVVTNKNRITYTPLASRNRSRGFTQASGVCKTKILQMSGDGKGKGMPKLVDGDDEDDENDKKLCGICGGNYGVYEFWICCDKCDTWIHGKCAKTTPQMAESMDQYKCPSCITLINFTSSVIQDNLCLYGHPNETWEVAEPVPLVPAELPEPVLGINWCRDGNSRKDWFSLVALHSDLWLLSMAFYFGVYLNHNERERLFSLINDLPTVSEVVTDKKPMDKPTKASGSKSRGFGKLRLLVYAKPKPWRDLEMGKVKSSQSLKMRMMKHFVEFAVELLVYAKPKSCRDLVMGKLKASQSLQMKMRMMEHFVEAAVEITVYMNFGSAAIHVIRGTMGNKDNLCLYGHANGTWEVNDPSQIVQENLPEPIVGISWSRDLAKHWLTTVAVNCDSWLLSLSFHVGSLLDPKGRKQLFNLIKDLPTVYDVVTENKPIDDKPTEASESKSWESTEASGVCKTKILQMSEDRKGKSIPKLEDETFCGICGGCYSVYEFWISCDTCNKWFHGKCVKITPKMAESMKQYKCSSCSMKQ